MKPSVRGSSRSDGFCCVRRRQRIIGCAKLYAGGTGNGMNVPPNRKYRGVIIAGMNERFVIYFFQDRVVMQAAGKSDRGSCPARKPVEMAEPFFLRAVAGDALKVVDMAVETISIHRISEEKQKMGMRKLRPGYAAKIMGMSMRHMRLFTGLETHNKGHLPVVEKVCRKAIKNPCGSAGINPVQYRG